MRVYTWDKRETLFCISSIHCTHKPSGKCVQICVLEAFQLIH